MGSASVTYKVRPLALVSLQKYAACLLMRRAQNRKIGHLLSWWNQGRKTGQHSRSPESASKEELCLHSGEASAPREDNQRPIGGKRSRGEEGVGAFEQGVEGLKRRKSSKRDTPTPVTCSDSKPDSRTLAIAAVLKDGIAGPSPVIRPGPCEVSAVVRASEEATGPATPPPEVVRDLDETFSAAAAETEYKAWASQDEGLETSKALRRARRKLKQVRAEPIHTEAFDSGTSGQPDSSTPRGGEESLRTNPHRTERAEEPSQRNLKRVGSEPFPTVSFDSGEPSQPETRTPGGNENAPRTNPPRRARAQEPEAELDPGVEEALRYLGVTFGQYPGGRYPRTSMEKRQRKERRIHRWWRSCQQRALWPSQRWYLGFTERLATAAKGKVGQLTSVDRWRVEQLEQFGRDHLADAALGRLGTDSSGKKTGSREFEGCDGDGRSSGGCKGHGRSLDGCKRNGGSSKGCKRSAGSSDGCERNRGSLARDGALGSAITGDGMWLESGRASTGGVLGEELNLQREQGLLQEAGCGKQTDADSEDWGAPEDYCGSGSDFGGLARLHHFDRGEGTEAVGDFDVSSNAAGHVADLRVLRLMAKEGLRAGRVQGGGGALQVAGDCQGEDPGTDKVPRGRSSKQGALPESGDEGGRHGGEGAAVVPPEDLEELLDGLVLEPVVYAPASCRTLSAEESAAVNAVFQPGTFRGSDEVACMDSQVVAAQELKALNGTCWLNDQVVNFYMDLIQRRNEAERKEGRRRVPRVHVLNSFFYTRLLQSGAYDYGGVRRWTKKVNVFEHDVILTPINLSNTHWALISMNMKGRCVEYYDSLSGPVESTRARIITQTVLRYLEDESRDKLHHELDHRKDWTVRQMLHGVPRQGDGGSCGVFVCAYADLLAQGARPPFAFSQANIPTMRRAMAADILAGRIGPG